MESGETTVLVADDQAMIRAGLVALLSAEPDLRVLAEAEDGEGAVAAVRRRYPDVVLMDVRMPGMDGISAAREIISCTEGATAVIMLTVHDLDEYVYAALRAGAGGFLLKSVEANDLVQAVRAIAAGEGVLAPQITRKLIDAFAATEPPSQQTPVGLDELTDRERDVLICLGRGMSNAQTSATLYISETTVKTHVSRVLAKLGAQSRVQAAILAQEAGLVPER